MDTKISTPPEEDKPARRTMEDYDNSFENEPQDKRRCTLEIPRLLRDKLKAAAKRSGRTMVAYLEWTIPDDFGKTRTDYEREEKEYEEKMRLIDANYVSSWHMRDKVPLNKDAK